ESFGRDFKRLPKEIQERAGKAIQRIAQNPSHPSLRTKKLKGSNGIWEASITMSCRMTFFRSEAMIILRRIGAHDILRQETP
ncbi:MAG: type II toxin-antitoxin system RelE/ParE family toxin, partial [Terriglobia bacterium]